MPIRVVQLREHDRREWYVGNILHTVLGAREGLYKGRTVDKEYIENSIRQFMYASTVDTLLALDGDTYLGVAIAVAQQGWMCPDISYNELLVAPSPASSPHTKGRVLLKLIRAMEERAKFWSAKFMCIGTSTGMQTEKYVSLLTKLGYSPFGASLKKEL